MQEFFVANNRVDIARNQIVREGEVIALEPKVLEVLRVLAEHQGQVVAHETLLDTVWPDMVVAPNALQRCIGQLRKALNDDGKTQGVIATHPKKGYSLLAPVTIRSSAAGSGLTRSGKADNTKKPIANKPPYPWLLVVAIAVLIIMVFVAIFASSLQPTDTQPLQKFTRLSPITATDASEFYSTYSPDGRYVAFSRKVSGSLGHMWVLDRDTGREIRLTQQAGSYGKPNWSTDGKHMAFLETTPCPDNCEVERCVDIDVIFVPLALSEPQPVNKSLKCANIPFLGLEWMDEKHLVAILDQEQDKEKNQEPRSRIIKLDSQTGAVETLFASHEAQLYALSYSPVKQSLAVMQVKPQQAPTMFLLSPEHGTVTHQVFTPPERYNSQVRWAPVWDQAGEHFLFSASSRLYLMDLQGRLRSQIIPTFEDISYPMFHPNGDSIAMTLGKIDTDVAQLHITAASDDHNQKQNQKSYTETPFARSILRESHAQYQPGGNMIAFFSKRGGNRQIWLTDNNPLADHQAVSQLSHIKDLFPEHFVWSPTGQQIAVSTEHQLILLDLQGKMQWLPLPFRITQLYQWLPGNELLMQVADAEGTKLVRFQLATQHATTLQPSQTQWAQSDGNSTWFIDNERRLMQIQNGTTERLTPTSQLNVGARFFLRNQQLFILSNKDDIWRLNLNNNGLNRLFHYPNTTVHLTDVSNDGQRLLISKQLSAKKEIVLLTP